MRKTLSVILSVIMLLSLLAVGTYAAPEGTAIGTAEEFAAMEPTGKYYLSADITISAAYASDFAGTLDGNGHTITTKGCPVFEDLEGKVLNLTIAGDDVNATADFGALANYCLEEMYAENVTNKVNVTVTVSEGTGFNAAGFVATSGQYAILNFVNCVNDGNITASSAKALEPSAEYPNGEATADIPAYAGGFVGFVATFNAHNCVNNGAVKAISTVVVAPGGVAGGLASKVAAVESCLGHIDVEYCINNGEVYGSLDAGGLVGYAGAKGNSADLEWGVPHTAYCNVNYGTVTGHRYASGVVGYIYANGSNSQQVANVKYNLNVGKILGGRHVNKDGKAEAGWISNILSYSNSTKNVIQFNLGLGELAFHAETDNVEPNWTWLGCSSANYENNVDVHDNYVLDDEHKLVWTTYASSDSYDACRHDFAWGETNNYVKRITMADLADGSFAYNLNKAANCNAFNQTLGVDAYPTPLLTSKAVVSDGAGGYKNGDAPEFAAVMQYEITTSPEATSTAAPTTSTAAPTTTAAPTGTTAAPTGTSAAPAGTTAAPAGTEAPADTTAAAGGGCGSVIGIGVALVAILGVAYVSKKKF